MFSTGAVGVSRDPKVYVYRRRCVVVWNSVQVRVSKGQSVQGTVPVVSRLPDPCDTSSPLRETFYDPTRTSQTSLIFEEGNGTRGDGTDARQGVTPVRRQTCVLTCTTTWVWIRECVRVSRNSTDV